MLINEILRQINATEFQYNKCRTYDGFYSAITSLRVEFNMRYKTLQFEFNECQNTCSVVDYPRCSLYFREILVVVVIRFIFDRIQHSYRHRKHFVSIRIHMTVEHCSILLVVTGEAVRLVIPEGKRTWFVVTGYRCTHQYHHCRQCCPSLGEIQGGFIRTGAITS